MHKNLFDLIVYSYQFFYSKVFSFLEPDKKFSNYKLSVSRKATDTINSFLTDKQDYQLSLGENYFFDYFSFQFFYWANSEKIKVMRFTIHDVLSKKSQKRYSDRTDASMYYVHQFIKNIGITKSEFIKDKTNNFIDLQYESNKRRVYYNTEKKVAHCVLLTSLYNSKLSICRMCNSKNICKQLKRDIYDQSLKH